MERGSPIRVCLVSGAPTTGRCGIHDYVVQLAAALNRAGGIEAGIISHQDWSFGGTLRLLRIIRGMHPDVVQLQYPMIVGWRSLGPQLLGFGSSAPHVVTLHEFSSFTPVRQWSLSAFAIAARQIVFTTEFERQNFSLRFPRFGAKAVVVPIGSNIPFFAHQTGRETTIVHFGQIKPGRGLEDFLTLAKIAAKENKSWRFEVIGAPVVWAAEFVAEMRERTSGNVAWRLDISDVDVAHALASATAAYLPYPDGVSERRGSLIAALGNGLPVVTTAGPFQTEELARIVCLVSNPEAAYVEITALVCDPVRREAMRSAALSFVEKFNWQRIAEAYGAIYRNVARSAGR